MCLICTKLDMNVHHHVGFGREFETPYKYANRLVEAEKAGKTLMEYAKGTDRWGVIHGHSEYSLLDGGAKINNILDKAKAMGQDFVAITDHGNMFGAVKAHKYAKEIGIKHIVGCELYLTPYGTDRFHKTFAKGERAYTHLVVLAKNKQGYANLMYLSSMGYLEGGYRMPRIDREILKEKKEGLIVTTSCVGGSIPQLSLNGQLSQAEKDFLWFKEEFGEDFYVEYQHHNIDIEKKGFEFTMLMADKYNVPVIATSDSHYLNSEDILSHDMLLCIGMGEWVDNPDRKFRFDGTGYWYMSEEEVHGLFGANMKEAIYNTGKLADKIDDQVIEFGSINLPTFEVPQEEKFQTWNIGKGDLGLWQSLKQLITQN